MSQPIYSKPKPKRAKKTIDYSNSSTIAINPSDLYEKNYNNTSTISSSNYCDYCESLGSSPLINPC